MDGYSGADVRLVCKDAAMMCMRNWISNKTPEEILKTKDNAPLDAVVTMEDFKRALKNSNPSVRQTEDYEQWANEFSTS